MLAVLLLLIASFYIREKVKVSRSVTSNSLRPHGLQPTRLLRPWDFPGNSTGVGRHFLLQGIFPTQGSNPGLLHYRQMLYKIVDSSVQIFSIFYDYFLAKRVQLFLVLKFVLLETCLFVYMVINTNFTFYFSTMYSFQKILCLGHM